VTGYVDIPAAALRGICEALFASYGFTPGESQAITGVLLRADLCGIESHGVQRLVRYDEEIACGFVDTAAKPEVVFETPVSAVIDARKAMGQLAGIQAMNLAIDKAEKAGIGMVSVRNSNHYGIAGYYTNLAASRDLIGLCMTNTEAICVPTNGKRAMLGTNAIAFAMPAEGHPVSFDAATTVAPRGTLEVYRKNGKPLPAGWALDAEGKPTTDAALVIDNIIRKLGGGIAPLGGASTVNGGHKGFGFALMVEIFTGILSGGKTSNHVNVRAGQVDICHHFAAIDYGIFGDKQDIRQRLSAYLRELRESPRAEGQERIYVHGDKEAESMAQRVNGVIPVNQKTLEEIRRIASKRNVPADV
jgi:LDH2 family malate/lactate/ureidoglycolate dehydrogenase